MSSKIETSAAHALTASAPSAFSLAARLTLWYAVSAFALVLFSTGFLYWALVGMLDRVDDQFLHNEIRLMSPLLYDRSENDEALRKEVELESEVYVRLLDGDGRMMVE